MSVRVLEIAAAPAIVAVDLARLALAGVRPVGELALLDPREDRVELGIADQERVVLRRDLAVRRDEVEVRAVPGCDHIEGSPVNRRRQAEHLGEELRRRPRIACRQDGVVELDCHDVLRSPQCGAVQPDCNARPLVISLRR